MFCAQCLGSHMQFRHKYNPNTCCYTQNKKLFQATIFIFILKLPMNRSLSLNPLLKCCQMLVGVSKSQHKGFNKKRICRLKLRTNKQPFSTKFKSATLMNRY